MTTQVAPTPKIGSVQKNGKPESRQALYSVYETKDYDLFKLMTDNRNINLLHVNRLIESFRYKHLISPIIVNDKYEVIDGQHRLKASIETGMPIHYIVIPDYGIEEVQILNTNQKNWVKMDYLLSYCAAGLKPYLEFKEFMDHFQDFKIQAAERILTGYYSGSKQGKINGQKMYFKDFQEGKLVIPDLNKSYSIAKKIMDFKQYYAGFNKGTFISSVIPLFSSKNYNHKEMMYKLSTCPTKLEDCLNVEAYRLLLENIYNYKRLKENKVSFRYEG